MLKDIPIVNETQGYKNIFKNIKDLTFDSRSVMTR